MHAKLPRSGNAIAIASVQLMCINRFLIPVVCLVVCDLVIKFNQLLILCP